MIDVPVVQNIGLTRGVRVVASPYREAGLQLVLVAWSHRIERLDLDCRVLVPCRRERTNGRSKERVTKTIVS